MKRDCPDPGRPPTQADRGPVADLQVQMGLLAIYALPVADAPAAVLGAPDLTFEDAAAAAVVLAATAADVAAVLAAIAALVVAAAGLAADADVAAPKC